MMISSCKGNLGLFLSCAWWEELAIQEHLNPNLGTEIFLGHIEHGHLTLSFVLIPRME